MEVSRRYFQGNLFGEIIVPDQPVGQGERFIFVDEAFLCAVQKVDAEPVPTVLIHA